MKKRTKQNILSFILTSSTLLTMSSIPVWAEPEQEFSDGSPANPVHHCTRSNDITDDTDWSYVYFGSYPQTEVTGNELTSAITGLIMTEMGMSG